MTLVIRIKLSLLAVITVVTFSADADGQIFRRMRDNIRSNYPPQGPVAPAQVAPQPIRPSQTGQQRQGQGQFGQSLTPYSRLSPQQRSASETAQVNPNANPANQTTNPGQVNVRVVTYYDPRTGRTYQRRFLLQPNNGAAAQVDRQKITRGNSPGSAVSDKPAYDKIPRPIAANPPQQLRPRPSTTIVRQQKFDIPPISVNQGQNRIQQPTVTSQPMPTLAGPQTVTSSPMTATSPTIETRAPLLLEIDSPTAPGQDLEITAAPIDTGDEIQIDTAVTPATVNSDDIRISAPVSEGISQTAFSVLEVAEDTESAAPSDFDIEINSADEIEAFFDQ